jgi:uncharacterized protein YunC (DUF1805 family)
MIDNESIKKLILPLNINGNIPLFIFMSKKAYIVNYYLDIKAAERVGDLAAVSSAATTIDEFLKSKIQAVTEYAANQYGIKPGMQVKRAIKIILSKEQKEES